MNQTGKIIVAVVITAIVVGGGFYFLEQNKQVETPQVTQENETQTPVVETEKTFEGSGFSFTYPKTYIADDKGLWTEEGYKLHTNPPETCDTCQIPEVEVKAVTTNDTLDEQIISDFDLSGTTLAEQGDFIKYETVKIGDNDFIKITVSDMFDVTGYYTKHNNVIVAFRVYFGDKDNEALRDIISTLKF